MTKKMLAGAVAPIGALALTLSASAGFVELGDSGWAAEWDDGLDPFVDIAVDAVSDEAVFIQKSAEFRPEFGTVPIVFRQIARDAVGFIVINDEIITNNQGVDWVGFEMELLDGNDAFFDPARTLASGGGGPIGFSISPFTEADFSDDLQTLKIGGGTVEDGDVWFPGDGPDDGQLWIEVHPSDEGPFTTFILKETPQIPGPAALALLAIAGLRRSRRRS